MARTIEERLNLNSNALNALRLTLALCVILSHSFPISGVGPDPGLGGMSLGGYAVGGFFTISGYLITRSRLRSTLGSYTWRRFLRIFPGFWSSLLFTAFVAAWLGGRVRDGWSAGNAFGYVLSYADMSGPRPLAPTALAGSPYPFSWNGSLWSLRYEVACYVVTGLVLLAPRLWRRRWLLFACFVATTAASLHPALDGHGALSEVVLLVPFFLAGVVLLRFADRLPLTGRGALVALGAFGVGLAMQRGEALAPLPLAYMLIWAGAAAPSWLKKVGARNDLSYGTYLYAFPVQQLLFIAGAARWGVAAFASLSAVCTLPLAATSWYVIERPAMMAKHLPRRWRRGAGQASSTRTKPPPLTRAGPSGRPSPR